MQIRPSNLAKIASGTCRLDDYGVVRQMGQPVMMNIGDMLRFDVVAVDQATRTLFLTPKGVGLLNRKTSTSTLLSVIRAVRLHGSLVLVGDMTRPVKFRRQTIEQMVNEGYLVLDGPRVFLTAIGDARLSAGLETLTFAVRPENVAVVRNLIAPYVVKQLYIAFAQRQTPTVAELEEGFDPQDDGNR